MRVKINSRRVTNRGREAGVIRGRTDRGRAEPEGNIKAANRRSQEAFKDNLCHPDVTAKRCEGEGEEKNKTDRLNGEDKAPLPTAHHYERQQLLMYNGVNISLLVISSTWTGRYKSFGQSTRASPPPTFKRRHLLIEVIRGGSRRLCHLWLAVCSLIH